MNRRGAIAAGVIALWLAGLAALARREFFQPRTEAFAEAGLRVSPGAVFYTVESGTQLVGYASSTIDTAPGALRVTDALEARLPIGGKVHEAIAHSVINLSRALVLRGFRFDVTADSTPFAAEGSVAGDSQIVVVVHPDSTHADTQRIALHGSVIVPTLVPLIIALGEQPKLGKHYTLPLFDPATMAPKDVRFTIAAESLFVLVDSARFDSAGRTWMPAHRDTVRAWQIVPDEAAAGVPGWTWVDAEGRGVELRQAGGLTLRRTAYEIAFENWRLRNGDSTMRANAGKVPPGQDIMETTAIAAHLTEPVRELDRLAVVVRGTSLAGFEMTSPRQYMHGDTLFVQAEQPTAFRADYQTPIQLAASDPMRRYLQAEPLLEVNDPMILAQAARIAGGEHDPARVAQRLTRWVHDSLRKEYSMGVPSAIAVLRTRKGDCNEHAQLFVALARALGLPARVSAGLAYVDGKFYYHAWPEVYLHDWVAVDPTFGEFPADAAHLRFVTGGLLHQAALLRLVGELRLEVVKPASPTPSRK